MYILFWTVLQKWASHTIPMWVIKPWSSVWRTNILTTRLLHRPKYCRWSRSSVTIDVAVNAWVLQTSQNMDRKRYSTVQSISIWWNTIFLITPFMVDVVIICMVLLNYIVKLDPTYNQYIWSFVLLIILTNKEISILCHFDCPCCKGELCIFCSEQYCRNGLHTLYPCGWSNPGLQCDEQTF